MGKNVRVKTMLLKQLDEFINAIPKKRLPKHIDWDKEYYSQFE